MADQFFESGKRAKRASSARHLFAARDAFQEDIDLHADAAEASENAAEEPKREVGGMGRGAFAGYVPRPVEIANAGRGIRQEHDAAGEQLEWLFPYDDVTIDEQAKQPESVPTQDETTNAEQIGFAEYMRNGANGASEAYVGFPSNEVGEHSPAIPAYASYIPNEPEERSVSAHAASEAATPTPVHAADTYAGYTPNEPDGQSTASAVNKAAIPTPEYAAISADDTSNEPDKRATVTQTLDCATTDTYTGCTPCEQEVQSLMPFANEAKISAPESAAAFARVDHIPAESAEAETSVPTSESTTPTPVYGIAAANVVYTSNNPNDPSAVPSANESTPPIIPTQTSVDFSAYYRRGEASTGEIAEPAEPAFAPPPKMDAYLTHPEPIPAEPEPPLTQAANVYRPREATWADTARRKVLGDTGYQVREDRRKKRRRKKKHHPMRNALVIALALVALCGVGYLMREDLSEWVATLTATPAPSVEAFTPITTPEPVKGYDAAPPLDIADGTRTRISAVSGTVAMETCAVTDLNVLTRNLRPDGTYDYYLFTSAEGRLLCYFEGLGELDMYPQEGGGFYVRQAPYLVGANGAATIRLADLEATLGEALILHPMYNGWSVAENKDSANYLSAAGQLFSRLWFARAFPFTGKYTLAYVDTGTADENQRYLLYILGADGSMNRWLATDDMSDVIVAINGMAYMNDGKLYRLPDTSTPLLTTPRLDVYVNCGAMVVQDAETGKLALYVNGEQHYDFAYDSIHPVESDIRWTETLMEGEEGVCAVHTVAGTAYPQPLAHYFALEREGQTEYVALSAVSSCPIVLESELGVPEQGGMNP